MPTTHVLTGLAAMALVGGGGVAATAIDLSSAPATESAFADDAPMEILLDNGLKIVVDEPADDSAPLTGQIVSADGSAPVGSALLCSWSPIGVLDNVEVLGDDSGTDGESVLDLQVENDGTNGHNGTNGTNGTNGQDGTNGTNGHHGTTGDHNHSLIDAIDDVDVDADVIDDVNADVLNGNDIDVLDGTTVGDVNLLGDVTATDLVGDVDVNDVVGGIDIIDDVANGLDLDATLDDVVDVDAVTDQVDVDALTNGITSDVTTNLPGGLGGTIGSLLGR